MSLRFPCACPRAKQIVVAKSWLGYAGAFAFPGFKANWLYTSYVLTPTINPSTGEYSWNFVPTGGQWTYSVTGAGINGGFNYTCTGSAANFAVGDLVLREYPAATEQIVVASISSTPPTLGPIVDYLTGVT